MSGVDCYFEHIIENTVLAKILLPSTMSASEIPSSITFTFTKDGISCSSKLTLQTSGSWCDYDLHTSHTAVKKNADGSYTPSEIEVSVTKKTIGQNSESVSVSPSDENLTLELIDIKFEDDMYTIEGDTPCIVLKKDDEVIDRVDIAVYKDGADGQPGGKGERGQIVYPAGVWNAKTEYKAGNNAVPYVERVDSEDKKVYYVLTANSSVNQDPLTSTDIWQPMETFSSVFTDLIVAQYGNIGGAVYCYYETANKKYEFLISNEGSANTADGVDGSEEYKHFMVGNDYDVSNLLTSIKSKSPFIPNVLICFTTGEAWFGGGIGVFDKNSGSVGGHSVTKSDHYLIPNEICFYEEDEFEDQYNYLEFKDNGWADESTKLRFYRSSLPSGTSVDYPYVNLNGSSGRLTVTNDY